MTDCVFCQIARGEAPASVVYQDERALVILDLFPVREGHCLVIPRQHHGYIGQLDESLSAHLFELARCTIRAQKKAGLDAVAHNIVLNDGPEANQHIPHVHLHVIPRKGGDTLAAALSWSTRMLNVVGLSRRRQRLDRLAALLAEHFPQ